MPVTMRDIAARAGVALATVSRVLNGKDGVSADKAAAVKEAARALGYRTVGGQRMTPRGRTGNIGFVLLHSPATEPEAVARVNPFFSIVLNGVHAAAQHHGYRVLYTLCERTEHATGLPDSVASQVDLVLIVGWAPEVQLRRLLASGVAAVLVDTWRPNLRADAVVTDNAAGTRSAILHLYERGARRIGHVGGPDANPSFRERRAAFHQAIADMGLTSVADREAEPGPGGGYSGIAQMWANLPESDRPDGLFFGNDAMALGALRWLAEQGIAVPGEVRVVGFDDIPPAEHVTPALSTVRVHKHRMGELAVEIGMLRLRDPNHTPIRIVMETEMVVRETT